MPEIEEEESEPKKQSIEYIQASGIHTWVRRTFQILIVLGLLAFIYKYLNSYSCDEVGANFKISPDTLRVNETVTFQDLSNYSKLQLWDFGDDSTEVNKRTVNHSYAKQGEYFVTLRINDKCEVTKRLWVLPAEDDIRFACPRIVVVGQIAKFYDQTLNSTSSVWDFGDKTTGSGRETSHIYTFEGVKIVKLMVNNDKNKVKMTTITVVPKDMAIKTYTEPFKPEPQPQPQPEALIIGKIPMAPPLKPVATVENKVEIDKIQVEEFLMQVAENQKKANDFSRFCCGNLNFGIRANQDRLSFTEFCSKIQGKKLKIQNLEIQKDDKGCIIYFKIDYRTSIRLRTLQNVKAPE